jgi:hypothetical protein
MTYSDIAPPSFTTIFSEPRVLKRALYSNDRRFNPPADRKVRPDFTLAPNALSALLTRSQEARFYAFAQAYTIRLIGYRNFLRTVIFRPTPNFFDDAINPLLAQSDYGNPY